MLLNIVDQTGKDCAFSQADGAKSRWPLGSNSQLFAPETLHKSLAPHNTIVGAKLFCGLAD